MVKEDGNDALRMSSMRQIRRLRMLTMIVLTLAMLLIIGTEAKKSDAFHSIGDVRDRQVGIGQTLRYADQRRASGFLPGHIKKAPPIRGIQTQAMQPTSPSSGRGWGWTVMWCCTLGNRHEARWDSRLGGVPHILHDYRQSHCNKKAYQAASTVARPE